MRCVALLALLHGLLAGRPLAAQERAGDVARARADARNLLQNVSSSPFLDSLEVEGFARVLLQIRAAIPEVRDISDYGDLSRLALPLSEAGRQVVDTAGVDAREFIVTRRVTRLGIAAIDSLNRSFGVDSVELEFWAGTPHMIYPYLPGIPNVVVLARAYGNLPEVDYAGPALTLGDGNWIAHFRKGGVWHFVFSSGTGDCLNGCIRRDYYYVTYDPADRRAELVDVLLDGKFDTSKVHLWDIPTRLSVMPYGSYEDLRAQTTDPRWWVRQHAVTVLEYLLGDHTYPWRGDAAQDTAHFALLDRAVEEHRRDVLLLLADRVADEDEDVRLVARRALTRQAGTDYGGGEAGRERWRNWARSGR